MLLKSGRQCYEHCRQLERNCYWPTSKPPTLAGVWRLLYLARAASVSVTAARATLLFIIIAAIGRLLPIPRMVLVTGLVNIYLIVYLILPDHVEDKKMDEINTPPPVSALKKDRSPSFPFITLTKSIARARELFTAARRHEMRMPDAAAAMSYAPKSSGATQTLAALIAFGLVEDSGSGDARKFKITDLAFKALEDERPGAREAAMATAAMTPKLIAEYAEVWKEGRPADGICISELRIDRGFTEDGAKAFLRVFDDALSYLKVSDSDKKIDADDTIDPVNEDIAGPIEIGDLVRVEAAGQVVFEKTRVRAISGHWVFVEASKAGSKMTDVTLIEKAAPHHDEVPPTLSFPTDDPATADVEMDRFTVDEGVVKVTFPSGMTIDSVDELEQFFQLFIKKAKRRAGAKKPN